jgi:membrane protease YdiL (CAAX protease family)
VRGAYPWATRVIGNTTLLYALINFNFAFRFGIWVLPVFAYVRDVDRVDVFESLQLKQQRKRGIAIGLVLSVLDFLGTTARLGLPDWSHASVTWNSVLGTSALIGVFEEIPFRGFVLRKFRERFDF